ncbi:MAG TPA: HD domain-containing protein [Actinobacteria bacterium]|nr:HD domain-containing protein [Actinomycetes bacterium]HEX21543.1 HD domain-containing protein [Actinomycetota bacterium]
MNETAQIEYYQDKLVRRLSGKSFEHSLRTKDTATRLAGRHGVNHWQAAIAGLLHDYARDYSRPELLTAARQAGLKIKWVEEKNPYLLHAPLGAVLVHSELGVDDPLIIGAIRKHTIGGLEMNDLDRLVFLADVIEPMRKFPGLAEIRKLADEDLRAAFKEAYFKQLQFVLAKRAFIHPLSIKVWNTMLAEE